jgi:hypothetical protein
MVSMWCPVAVIGATYVFAGNRLDNIVGGVPRSSVMMENWLTSVTWISLAILCRRRCA